MVYFYPPNSNFLLKVDIESFSNLSDNLVQYANARRATIAAGDVLVFLDSHVETMRGWLEPLLEKIGREPKTCVLPSDGAILKFRGLTFRVAISMRVFRSSQRSFTTVSTKRIKDVEEKDTNA